MCDVFIGQGVSVLRGFHERLSPAGLYWRLERALSLLELDTDHLGGGVDRPSAGGWSSSSAASQRGGDWRCTDSTSARSWHHFIASAAAAARVSPNSVPSVLPHPALVTAATHCHQHHHHQQQQQQKLSD